MDAILSARGLTKRYGRRVGIEGVDLDVPRGSIFGFLGPNGAGKTTTIRVLLGFMRATAGRATILNLDCWRDSVRIRHHIGYVPGDLRLWPWMNVENGLGLMSMIRDRDVRPAGMDLAQRFELDDTAIVRRMSRGMRQKLGLILALVHEPPVIILDEPTSGLDPLMQDELMTILRERAAGGATVIFSSHTLTEVEAVCDRVAIVRRGRIVADETLAALRRKAARSVMIRFADARTAAETSPPSCLHRVVRSGDVWQAQLLGPPAALIEYLRQQVVADFTLGPPSLDAIFRSHYHDDADVELTDEGSSS